MNIRELVNHVIFRNKKYELVKNNFAKQFFPGHQLQFSFEYIVYHRLSNTKDFRFIQIGANDGKRSDPIWKFVNSKVMRGISIEPLPHYFSKLKDNYSGLENIKLVNKALHPSKKEEVLYCIDESAIGKNGIPEWARGIATFNKSLMEKHGKKIPNFSEHLVEEKVDCISWDELVELYGIEKLDLLVIDTEGFDYEVIKMVDFSKIKPAIIRFEHSHLSNDDLKACYNLLVNSGYKLFYEVCDTTAYLT
jgi:FkbM family methyltransferase